MIYGFGFRGLQGFFWSNHGGILQLIVCVVCMFKDDRICGKPRTQVGRCSETRFLPGERSQLCIQSL